MKKIYSLIAGLLLTASVFAQAPQKMSYQAVIRNSSNALITSTPVGMKISILQGSPTGTAVYVETQTLSTNANGLASLEIGSGSIITGTFAGINWANGPYFIKTETDPSGGTNYSITGISELLSVPYALYAKSAGAVFNYIISYPRAVTINPYLRNDSVAIDISWIDGGSEQINFSIQNLPTGWSYQFSKNNSGPDSTIYLKFFATQQLNDNGVMHAMTIHCQSQFGKINDYPIHVTSVNSCGDLLIGTYTLTRSCNNSGTNTSTVTITSTNIASNPLFFLGGLSLSIDCSNSSLTFMQGSSDCHATGTGAFTMNGLNVSTITMNVSIAGWMCAADTCVYTLTP